MSDFSTTSAPWQVRGTPEYVEYLKSLRSAIIAARASGEPFDRSSFDAAFAIEFEVSRLQDDCNNPESPFAQAFNRVGIAYGTARQNVRRKTSFARCKTQSSSLQAAKAPQRPPMEEKGPTLSVEMVIFLLRLYVVLSLIPLQEGTEPYRCKTDQLDIGRVSRKAIKEEYIPHEAKGGSPTKLPSNNSPGNLLCYSVKLRLTDFKENTIKEEKRTPKSASRRKRTITDEVRRF